MTVLDKILKLLTDAAVPFEKVEHVPVHTSMEAAAIRGSSLDIGAKALVCIADKRPVLLVVPGDMKADFKKFKELFHVKDMRMATPDEVFELTGLRIGCIPPIGKVLNLMSYFDTSIKSKDKLAFNAGDHSISVFMSAKDLILIEQPGFGNFAVPLVI